MSFFQATSFARKYARWLAFMNSSSSESTYLLRSIFSLNAILLEEHLNAAVYTPMIVADSSLQISFQAFLKLTQKSSK
jgi:hypothetical protein